MMKFIVPVVGAHGILNEVYNIFYERDRNGDPTSISCCLSWNSISFYFVFWFCGAKIIDTSVSVADGTQIFWHWSSSNFVLWTHFFRIFG